MKVLIQNLQKRNSLATDLCNEYDPDIILAQEINLHTETNDGCCYFPANNVSSMGYGTAIGIHNKNKHKEEFKVSDIKKVQSPNAEFGGMFYKKTTIATIQSIQFVSFHGYNGQPFKSISKLVEHVHAVVDVLSSGPVVFAGDFNTWSQEHVDAVKHELETVGGGFHHVYSWPYGRRDIPLDHVFLRGDLELNMSEYYECASDHRGALLEINDS